MNHQPLDHANWRKSTRSESANGCVEVGCARGVAVVRDTKDRAGAVLAFSPRAWQRFLACAAKGELNPA